MRFEAAEQRLACLGLLQTCKPKTKPAFPLPHVHHNRRAEEAHTQTQRKIYASGFMLFFGHIRKFGRNQPEQGHERRLS